MIVVFPQILAIAIIAMIAFSVWPRRHEPGGMPYLFLMLGQAIWMVFYILEVRSDSLSLKLFCDNVEFAGGYLWCIALVAFTIEYCSLPLRYSRRILVACSVPYILCFFVHFLFPAHPLVRANARLVSDGNQLALMYGITPLVWMELAVFLSAYAMCVALLWQRVRHTQPLYRMQVRLVLAGNIMPFLGLTASAIAFADSLERDISPYLIAASNLLIGLGLYWYRLFDVVPMARDRVIEILEDAVLVLDSRDRIVDFNSAALCFFPETKCHAGRPFEEAASEVPALLAVCQEPNDVREEIKCVMNGNERFVDVKVSLLQGQNSVSVGKLVVIRDVTDKKNAEIVLQERKDTLETLVRERSAALLAANARLQAEMAQRERIEAQLCQFQKMEAIGRLAGGVAHDFNNLLTVILGNVELFEESLVGDGSLHENITAVKSASLQAAALTQQLLAFSRKQVLQPQVLDLNSVLDEMEKMLRRVIREDIELVLVRAPDLGLVRADPVQLQQVLLNLAANARDAMPRGGRLTIGTKNVVYDPQFPGCFNVLPSGPCVLLEVSDTGIGISQEVREKLFEPFFTTKEIGKGTGLGLATVHGIVQQSGGDIDVYSEAGLGTTFKIYLPQVDDSLSGKPLTPSSPAASSAPATETILLVEDEASIRELTERQLEQAGYTVISASEASEALERAKAHLGPINLLLTDVVMPGHFRVPDLAQRLLETHPDLRIIFMSGYAEETMVQHGIEEGALFLSKPFVRKELLAKVHEALHLPGTASGV